MPPGTGDRSSIPERNDIAGEFRAFGLTPGDVVGASVRSIGIPGASEPKRRERGTPPRSIRERQRMRSAGRRRSRSQPERNDSFSSAMVAARMSRVSGSVFNSEGRPAAGAQLLVTSTSGAGGSTSGGGTVAADGTFAISESRPDPEYCIEVRPQNSPGRDRREFASFPSRCRARISPGSDIVDRQGCNHRRRVVFEGTSPRENPTGPLRLRESERSHEPRVVLRRWGSALEWCPRQRRQLSTLSRRRASFLRGRDTSCVGREISDARRHRHHRRPFHLAGKQSVSGLIIRLTDKLTQIWPGDRRAWTNAARLRRGRFSRQSRRSRSSTRGGSERPGRTQPDDSRRVACARDATWPRPSNHSNKADSSRPSFRSSCDGAHVSLRRVEGETLALDLALSSALSQSPRILGSTIIKSTSTISVAALIALCAVSPGGAQQPPGFDRYFTDKTMRVDYFHSGGMGQEIVALERVVSDGPWPGSRTRSSRRHQPRQVPRSR